ncbi:MAG: hypothetical protein ABJH45_18845 [Paracoccaceae bacterium]
MKIVVRLGIYFVLAVGFLVACTPLPKAELNAYARTFEAFENVSNKVLDIVAPYERAATRKTNYTTTDCPMDQPRVLSNDPFCHQIRDAFATIGDPPLVKSYRNLISIIARFNVIVIAYSNGVSLQFIKQDVDEFSNIVGVFGATATAEFTELVDELTPLVQQSSNIRDRRELQIFLTANFETVEAAFQRMAIQSGALYTNVDTGTLRLIGEGGVNRKALESRRRELRSILANWTVLIEETQDLLQGMEFAISNPENLEVRIRNLAENSFEVFAGFEALNAQTAAIGTDGAFE